jgi:hypothetical protein
MYYAGQAISFLTQHGKERLLGPRFAEQLGCRLVRAIGYDTDQLGTFTRDIDRPGTQLAVARFKAQKATELMDCSIGLGSEGAFGADPVGGIMPWNTEVLVWIDKRLNIEIVGIAQGPGGGQQRLIADEAALIQFAEDVDFPAHALVLRPDGSAANPISKGIADWTVLIETFKVMIARSTTGAVFVEVDLRAHLNPTRQQMILRAADNLIQKVQSNCPECGIPGFWFKEVVAGLPCGLCHRPTRIPLARVKLCEVCHFKEEEREASGKTADPMRCDHCNP